MGALGLAKLARQADHLQAAIGQPRGQMGHHGAGIGKNQRAFIMVKAQQVEDCIVHIRLRHANSLIFDIAVLRAAA